MVIKNKFFYFRLNEWHHLYTGIIIVLLLLFFSSGVWQLVLWTLGWILIADDLGQHIMQGVFKNPDYHTPWHYAGKPFYILRRYLIKKYPKLNWLNNL